MSFRAGLLGLCGLALVAGCGTPIYSPSPPASGEPSTPVASVSATPTGSPLPTSGDLAQIFFAQFGAVSPPFQVRLDTTLTGFPTGTALEEAEVDGRWYKADLHVELDGLPAQDSQVIYIDGTAYVADSGTDAWQAYPDYDTVPPVNPFIEFDATEWQDMGPDLNTDGLVRLHSTTWRLPSDSASAERLTNVVFDLWLDENGVPLSGELTFQLIGSAGSGGAGYSASYEFSQVGQFVRIVAPIEAVTEAPSSTP